MKLTKNEAKKMAQTATSITRVENSEKEVTFEQMLDELKHSRIWHADQFSNKLFINVYAGLSFIVML